MAHAQPRRRVRDRAPRSSAHAPGLLVARARDARPASGLRPVRTQPRRS